MVTAVTPIDLQGLPVDRWMTEQSVLAYWAMGTVFGPAVSQNAKRHLVGHVKDIMLPGGHYDPVRCSWLSIHRPALQRHAPELPGCRGAHNLLVGAALPCPVTSCC